MAHAEPATVVGDDTAGGPPLLIRRLAGRVNNANLIFELFHNRKSAVKFFEDPEKLRNPRLFKGMENLPSSRRIFYTRKSENNKRIF